MKNDSISIAASYLSGCAPILEASNGTRYSALFLEPNPETIKQHPEIYPLLRLGYVLGILERCHLASVGSLARHCRWITGMKSNENNFLAFSACLRGFLESAADSHDLFQFLPITLVEARDYFYQALHNPENLKHEMTFGSLEDLLIHFAFAGRQPKRTTAPKNHVARTNADYLRNLQAFGVTGALKLYGELCELTHPAAPSVDCFLDPDSHSYTFNSTKDREQIADLVSRHNDDLRQLLIYSFNPPLASMVFLSRLVPGWAAPNANTLDEIGLVKKNLHLFDVLPARFGPPMHVSQFQLLVEAGTGIRSEAH